MDVVIDNPARRLLWILEQVKEKAEGAKGNKNNAPSIFDVFTNILGISNAPRSAILMRIGLIGELPRAVEHAMLAVKDELDMPAKEYLPWVGPAHNVLNINNLESKCSVITDQINVHQISVIRMCGYALARHSPESIVQEDQIIALDKAIHELIKSVRKAEMSAHLCEYIIKHLNIIRFALADYRIVGCSAMTDALAYNFGLIQLYPELFDEIPEHDSVWRGFQNVVGYLIWMCKSLRVKVSLLTGEVEAKIDFRPDAARAIGLPIDSENPTDKTALISDSGADG